MYFEVNQYETRILALEVGERDIDGFELRMREGPASLSVEVPGTGEGWVVLRRRGSPTRQVRYRAGAVTLPGLAVGEYGIEVESVTGTAQRTVDVRGAARVVVEVRR